MTGEKDNLNAGKFYWFLTEYRYSVFIIQL